MVAISKTARGRARKVMARRWDGDRSTRVSESLVVEEPLEIHVDGTLAASTMRTPGHDFELAVGFCVGEGWIGAGGVETVRYCGTGSAIETEFNVVSVDRREPRPEISPRIGPTTSSCGWCGTAGVEQLLERFEPMPAAAIAAGVVAAVGERVRVRQELFGSPGGSHAAASFSADGTIRHVREDIGRHNAVDKLLGRDVLDGTAPRPGDGVRAVRLGSGLVRARAEGVGGRVLGDGGRERAVSAGRVHGRNGRTHAGRVRPRRAVHRVRGCTLAAGVNATRPGRGVEPLPS